MKHHEDIWGWMLAADFFLAGMGGATLAIAAIADLSGAGPVSVAARLVAPVLIAMGAGLLVFELGRPFQGWRVFMNPKSVLTFGAWNMTLAIALGAANACTYIPFAVQQVPALASDGLRTVLSALLLVVGVIVAGYPGVLLARHNARPFWTGPGIAVLFTVSSFLTGTAVHQLANAFFAASEVATLGTLRWVAAGLAAVQLVLWPVYLYVKSTGTTTREAEPARKWISGSMAPAFWLGLFGCGSLLPLAVLFFAPQFAVVAAVLCMVGGLVLRYIVVLSGHDRTWIEGEQNYLARLPKGDEPFLKAWIKS